MAKHPHLLILLNKKTWKCMLEGCNFFVHLGLAHVLVGKSAICWNCEGRFTLNEAALKEDKPRCDECRIGMSAEELERIIAAKLEQK
jgi:hypothetical protein